MDIQIYHNDPNMPNHEYVRFIHDCFKERLDNGINFGCATFTLEQFRNALVDAYVVIVRDDESSIVASVTLSAIIESHHFGFRYAEHEFLAISPNYRGKNIGSLIEKEIVMLANELELDFIKSSTAFTATSSVKFHKKHGFKKILVSSYAMKNYYSWQFVKPLRPSFRMWLLKCLRLPVLWGSYVLCHLLYTTNGSKRF